MSAEDAPLSLTSKLAPQGTIKNTDGTYTFPDNGDTNKSFWKQALGHGRRRYKYLTVDELLEACAGYFEWIEANPLQEAKAFSYEGQVTVESLPKMRAATLSGMCMFIGINPTTWGEWRNPKEPTKYRPEFRETMLQIEAVIHEQKFTGAAAGLLNPIIISRDLGLAEKSEVSAPGGGPIALDTTGMSLSALIELRAAMQAAEKADAVHVPEEPDAAHDTEQG